MWLLAEIEKPNLLLFIGLAMACAILLFRSQRRIRQPARTSAPAAPHSATASNRFEPTPELKRWEVEMHDTAREVTARIDNKIRILEQLIRDADDRIARLQAADEWTADYSEPADEPAIALAKLSKHASQLVSPALAPSPAEALLRRSKAPSSSRHSDEIFALSDAGRSSAEIAQELNAPVGEIELILSLRQRRDIRPSGHLPEATP